MEEDSRARGTQHGDRHAFLARVGVRASAPHHPNIAHPVPTTTATAPTTATTTVDATDLIRSFVRAARAVTCTVDMTFDDEALSRLITEHGIRRAVVSRAPLAQAAGHRLASLGVDVATSTLGTARAADLGVTAPVAAIAATGSLVHDTAHEGGRLASLLPPMHLALVSSDLVVAQVADVVRPLAERVRRASNIVLVTGPSRTGDIELIITLGVHGPLRVHIGVVDPVVSGAR